MAVDALVSRARAREGVAVRVVDIPARVVLPAVVATSFVFRFVAALAHAVPVYFPDEYIYGTLARSLAETGRPLVRGEPAQFPALLEPLLAAPFWLQGDPALAYRLTQAENALAMSLAAVPMYLLARRLGLGKWLSLGAAGFSVAAPGLFFASFVLADPIAYPLVLAAACAAVYVLVEPTRRAGLALVGFAGLAAFARLQYVVVPIAFLVAALVVERGSPRRMVARFGAVLGWLALCVLVLVVAGVLGYYGTVLDSRADAGAVLHWLGVDALFLAWSAGLIVVPGALLGLWVALRAASSRAERGFAAFASALVLLTLLEAAIYAANGSARYQERYLIALVPLAAPLFGIWIRHGVPFRRVLLALAAALGLLAASVPLSDHTSGLLKQDSPLLLAVFRAEKALGGDEASLLIAAVAVALCGLAWALTRWPRALAAASLGLAGLAGLAISVAAYSVDAANARAIRASILPSDPRWIDRSGLQHVSLVLTPGAGRDRALEQAFWNRTIDSFLLMPGAAPADAFGGRRLAIDPRGRLLVDGARVQTALAVQNDAVTVELAGARLAGRGGSFELWRPDGTPRLSLLALGRFHDGWLAGRGRIVVWPNLQGITRGTLELRLVLPRYAPPLALRFLGPRVKTDVRLTPGSVRTVSFQVDHRGPWSVRFTSSMHAQLADGRVVSVRAEAPVFRRSL